MNTDPNRFLEKTKEILSKRAGNQCSSLYCQVPTSGPHTEDDQSVNVGEAAHIQGANPGSARYDPQMIPEARRSISNGIWLCRKCAKLIDNDEKKYTVSLLFKWKLEHEEKIRSQIESGGVEIEVRKNILNIFENESPSAKQIAIDKPEYWEYLLTIELLRSKLSEIKRRANDVTRGLELKPSRKIENENLLLWFHEKVEDYSAIAHLIVEVSNNDLYKAWGEPGEPGDEYMIKRSVDLIDNACKVLIDWDLEIRSTIVNEENEEVLTKMSGWTNEMLNKLDNMHIEMREVLLNKKKGHFIIKLDFETPKHFDELLKFVIEKTTKNT